MISLMMGLKRSFPWASLVITVMLTACGQSSESDDRIGLLEGEAIYKAECARCHGAQLEGQPNWRIRKADGKLPAPPHDATGHTWHHSDEQLFYIVKFGMVPPQAPTGYLTDMPGFGGKLSDAQIRRVMAFIESRWSPEIRAQRAERFPPQR